MQLITFVMVALFGGMTLALHDDNFIKWKVTIVYVVFALGLTISQIMGKPAIKGMLGKELTLPDAVWSTINWAWVMFFSGCAALNLYVAYHLPLDVWVNFKVFGLLAATLVFTLLTGATSTNTFPMNPNRKTNKLSRWHTQTIWHFKQEGDWLGIKG